MRMLRLVMVAALLLSFTACSSTSGPDAKEGEAVEQYPSLIVGTWAGTKGELEGAVVEVSRGGTVNVRMQKDGRAINRKGSYKLDGATLTVSMNDGEQRTYKIKHLSQQRAVMEENKEQDNVNEFTRK